MNKAFRVFSKVVDSVEQFYVVNNSTGSVYHVTDAGVKRINKLPDGAEENTWFSGVYSKLENARKGNWDAFENPAELLFAYAEEQQISGE